MSLRFSPWSVACVAVALPFLLGQASAVQEKSTAPATLERVWSVDGRWNGVVFDKDKGVIFALGVFGNCAELDVAGKTQRSLNLGKGYAMTLRLARSRGESGNKLLAFHTWSTDLRAYDLDGNHLWSYPRATGIDDVWAADLNGDNAEEVIVGYNGGGGVHVLNGEGQLLWKTTAVGNVWHVCAGDVRGTGQRQVVTTSAAGMVHVFGSKGKRYRDLDAGCYASMVRAGRLSPKDKKATVFVAGSVSGAEGKDRTQVLSALAPDGGRGWSIPLATGAMREVSSCLLAPGKSWLAVGITVGEVSVVDVQAGRIIATAKGQGMMPEIGWASRGDDDEPLLLVATGDKLNAFRVPATDKGRGGRQFGR